MRSRLGVSWEEADGMPWWQHAAYLEGLEWDLARESGIDPEERQQQAVDDYVAGRIEADELDSTLDDIRADSDLRAFAKMGMTVREVS